MPLERRKRITESDIVNRAVAADIAWWLRMNQRCPTCCVKLADLETGDSLYRHMAGQCEKDLLIVGIDWIRSGQNVDAPLADAADREEVKVKREYVVTGKMMLWIGSIFLALAALGGYVLIVRILGGR
jgi:hypothetical protein